MVIVFALARIYKLNYKLKFKLVILFSDWDRESRVESNLQIIMSRVICNFANI